MSKNLKLFTDDTSRQTYEQSQEYLEPYVGGVSSAQTSSYNTRNIGKYFIDYTRTEHRLSDFDINNKDVIEVEYLESTGTQYINTGYCPNYNTKIECCGMYTHQGTYDATNYMHFLYGVRETINNTIYSCDFLWNYYKSQQDNASQFGVSGGEYYTVDLRNQKLITINDNTGGYINGVKRFSHRETTEFQCTQPIYLLWCNVDGVGQATRPPYGRIYYCKIYENDVLIHDLIPVRIGNTGYMYDKVSRALFGNSGTGDFVLGKDYYDAQVEYLSVSNYNGTSPVSINSNIQYANGRGFGCKVSNITCNKPSPGWSALIGTSYTTSRAMIYVNPTNRACGLDWQNAGGGSWGCINDNRVKHIIDVKRNGTANQTIFYLNGESKQTKTNFNPGGTAAEKCIKFIPHAEKFNCRVYGFWVYDNQNNKIYDAIPVRYKGIGYMYDKISGKLCGNTSTGTLGIGPDLIYEYELQYLQSTGTQYIDTGIIPTNNTGLHTYAIINDNVDRYFVGSRKDGGNTRYGVGHSSNGFYYCWNTYQTTNRLTGSTGEFYLNFRNNKKFISIYNSDYKTSDLPNLTYTPTNSIWVFGSSGFNAWQAVCKIYYLQITQNSTVSMDLIPVSHNNIGYMYDRNSKQLFANHGTGTFTLGPQKTVPYDAKVEYIEGTGTQWIDTGITSMREDGVIIKLSTTDFGDSDFLCGSRKEANSMNGCFFIYCTTENNNVGFAVNASYTDSSVNVQDGSIHTILHRINGGYIDNTQVVSVTINTSALSTYSYRIFTINYGTEPPSISKFKLYSFKYFRCWSSNPDTKDTLILDLIPVRIGNSGYMYDKLSGRLFGNSGTGEFTLGPDVV